MTSASNVANSHLLKLIESLRAQLTHSNATLRNAGLDSLVNYLARHDAALWLPSNAVLIDFFLDKLNEPECLSITLDGLLILFRASPSFTVEQLSRFISSFVIHQLGQSLRLKSYQLLALMIPKIVPQSALQMSHELMTPMLMTSVEGEKDPRNLGSFFSLVSQWNTRLDWISPEFYEDWLGMILCYFPITFTPPPNDPFRISPAELRVQLLDCMVSFMPFERATVASNKGSVDIDLLIPSLTEKLAASPPSLAIDIFSALGRLLPFYWWLVKNALELSDVLLDEIWTCRHPELSRVGLETLSTLVSSLVKKLSTSDFEGLDLHVSVPLAESGEGTSIELIRSPLKEILSSLIARALSLLLTPDEGDQRKRRERLELVDALLAISTNCCERTSFCVVLAVVTKVLQVYEQPEIVVDDWKVIVSCHILTGLFSRTACLQGQWSAMPTDWFVQIGSNWQRFLSTGLSWERGLSLVKAFVALSALLTSSRIMHDDVLRGLFVAVLERVREVAFDMADPQESERLLMVGIHDFASAHSAFIRSILVSFWHQQWLQSLSLPQHGTKWTMLWRLLWSEATLRASVYESICQLLVTVSQDEASDKGQLGQLLHVMSALDLSLTMATLLSYEKFNVLLRCVARHGERGAWLLPWVSYSVCHLSISDQSRLYEALVDSASPIDVSVQASCFAAFSPLVVSRDKEMEVARLALASLERGSPGSEPWLASIFSQTQSSHLRQYILERTGHLERSGQGSIDLLLVWILKALAYETNAQFSDYLAKLEWRSDELYDILLNDQKYTLYSVKKKPYYRQWLFCALLQYLDTRPDVRPCLVFGMMKYFSSFIQSTESKRFMPFILKVFHSFSIDSVKEGHQILVLDHLLAHLKTQALPCSREFVHRLLYLCRRGEYSSVRMRAAQCLSLVFDPLLELEDREVVIQELGQCLSDPKRRVRVEIAKARNIWILKHADTEPTTKGSQ